MNCITLFKSLPDEIRKAIIHEIVERNAENGGLSRERDAMYYGKPRNCGPRHKVGFQLTLNRQLKKAVDLRGI